MKNLRYTEYLKSETFQEIKRKAISFLGEACQLCNSTENIHVHHRCYPDILGEEKLTDLTVLCGDCHSVFHFNQWAGRIKKRDNRRAPKGDLTSGEIEDGKARDIKKIKKMAAKYGMVVVDADEYRKAILRSEITTTIEIRVPFKTGYE